MSDTDQVFCSSASSSSVILPIHPCMVLLVYAQFPPSHLTNEQILLLVPREMESVHVQYLDDETRLSTGILVRSRGGRE